jgi:hypothetical protein
MKKIYIQFLLFGLITISITSCDDILETKLDDEIRSEQAITDLVSLKSAVVGLYDKMQSSTYYGGEFILAQELTGGIADATGFQERFAQLDKAIVPTSNTYIQNNWVDVYALVNASNLILNKMEELSLVDNDSKGSALFFRALGHFDALRQFGEFTKPNSKFGIPVSTQFLDAKTALLIPRASVAISYQQIIDDLILAETLLKNNANRFLVSKTAVDALLARVYLYKGDYDNAIANATKVISNSSYKLNAKYNDIYNTEGSGEAIFELQFLGIDGNSLTEFLSVSPPEVSANLNDYFKPMTTDDDPRANLYYNSGKVVFVDKYGSRDSEIDANSIIIKLSEIYLIRAEALAKKNPTDLTAALSDLNIVRTRSLPSKPILVTDVPNFDAFVNILLSERARELGFEGHRWFDVIRLNKAQTLLGIDAFRNVYPIPQNEITVSKGMLEQNPGY